MSDNLIPLTKVEAIKVNSHNLRGTLVESLDNQLTGAVASDDEIVLKFHGTYQQFDRDTLNERRKQFLEPDHSFMIRARVPGGVSSPQQWLVMDELCRDSGNQTLRLTTRQAFQLHGIVKRDLKPTFQKMHSVLLDAIAACGDVNRNVTCNPNPVESRAHQEVYDWSVKISEHLLPKTNAYFEIWLDGEKVDSSTEQDEIYGNAYLPRKFKTAVAIPPYNDVDIFSNDMGFIAIIENGELQGFNVTVGGGMGLTHGDSHTMARLADVIGFCTPDQVLKASEEIIKIQRDFGNREERRYARFKYTIADRGIEWFTEELTARLGYELAPIRDYEFISNSDRYGWIEGFDGSWNLNLFIENGRIKDEGDLQLLTGLREIAKIHDGDFRLTANQNLIVANISTDLKSQVEALVTKYNLTGGDNISEVRKNSMACVAFPTCPLAMAESERYLPSLVGHMEALLAKHNLADAPISVRMQGCPNGCARAVLAQIGFIGKGPGKYNMYLGAGEWGQRFSTLYKENIGEAEILADLDSLFGLYAEERNIGECFGDYVVRTGMVNHYENREDFHRKAS